MLLKFLWYEWYNNIDCDTLLDPLINWLEIIIYYYLLLNQNKIKSDSEPYQNWVRNKSELYTKILFLILENHNINESLY